MATFKAGDRVRRIGGQDGRGVILGGEYTVSDSTITFIRLRGMEGSYFPRNFELVEAAPVEPPKLSDMTDKELADKYRESVKNSRNLRKELLSRGFNLFSRTMKVAPCSTVPTSEYTFRKEIKTIEEV